MNHLFYGDNLHVLREHTASESVDLVYLDPPFNSNASYNVLFKGPSGNESPAQIEAFDDTWKWSEDSAGRALIEVKQSPYQEAAAMLDAMVGFLGKNAMTAYLCMMGIRLTELHRVLKPTGSLYLHCDPTASHYLKILLDAVFGKDRILNEIIWKRTFAHGSSRRWGPVHDTIFFYSKSGRHLWTGHKAEHDASYIEKHFRAVDKETGRRFAPITLTGSGTRTGDSGKPWRGIDPTASGRHWALPSRILEELGVRTGTVQERLEKLDEAGYIFWPTKQQGKPRLKHFADALTGVALSDVVTDIPPISAHSRERLGYPTQKPVALLERIVSASSNLGDVVLDPFCGCGTTVHAAEKLGRKWIGIDITPVAISLIRTRLFDAFKGKAKFEVIGLPRDVPGARMMFEEDDKTKKRFEMWACGLIDSYPQQGGKKGADGGIDGLFWFGAKKEHKAIVQVKGGKVSVKDMRELDAVVTKQKAAIGVLLTLEEPTKPMLDEVNQSARFDVDGFGTVPRLQIVTVGQALKQGPASVQTRIRHADTYKAAPAEKEKSSQGALDL